jgi:membrane protease YdiL (CAAX protease family)
MSTRIEESAPRRAAALAWAAVVTGFGLLLLRPTASSGRFSPLTLLGLYAALVWVSIDHGGTAARAARTSGPALAVGLCAAAVVALGYPPAPPVPRTAWALPLGVVAAVAEEAFFRGLLYRVLSRAGARVAVLGTAASFAAIHVPAYGVAALLVDLGAGLLLSWQRWASGHWAVPGATHAVANLLVVMP